jgi:hypothetical protein
VRACGEFSEALRHSHLADPRHWTNLQSCFTSIHRAESACQPSMLFLECSE